MSKSYVIQWKSKVNGRIGRGTRLLSKSEAEHLAAELNRDYPDIEHEAVEAGSHGAPAAAQIESEATARAEEAEAEERAPHRHRPAKAA